MDMFYQSLPGTRKQRLHFHRFMLRVHEELTALQGQTDPLDIVADRFKAETDVLCFDEFFVSDITDAMLLGGLMKALFARGMARRRSTAGAAMVGLLGWELVKIALTVAMLAAAPRVVPGLSWLALLVGMVVTMKTYWIALLARPGVRRTD